MRRKLLTAAVTMGLVVPSWSGWAEDAFQYSTIAALMAAAYDGQLKVGELPAKGNFGLGTFDDVDGEMVVLDGDVWRVAADGRAYRAEAGRETPFVVVSHYRPDLTVEVPAGLTFAQLEQHLDKAIANADTLVAGRIDLSLTKLKARSIRPQQRPYRPLAEVVKTDQVVFNHQGVAGTLVGFRFPPSAAGANVAGWHFHFVDSGRSFGGHVLDLLTAEGGKAGIQRLDGVRLSFPAAASAAHDAALDMVEKWR